MNGEFGLEVRFGEFDVRAKYDGEPAIPTMDVGPDNAIVDKDRTHVRRVVLCSTGGVESSTFLARHAWQSTPGRSCPNRGDKVHWNRQGKMGIDESPVEDLTART